MPITITKILYSYADLLERAETKAKDAVSALEKAEKHLKSVLSSSSNIRQALVNVWAAVLEEVGFLEPEFRFSFDTTFYGASFTCKDIDLPRLIDVISGKIVPAGWNEIKWYVPDEKFAHLRRLAGTHITDPELSVVNGNREHERSVCFSAFIDLEWVLDPITSKNVSSHPRVLTLFNDFLEEVEYLRQEISKAIYEDATETRKYLVSKDYLIWYSDVNHIYFTEEGVHEPVQATSTAHA